MVAGVVSRIVVMPEQWVVGTGDDEAAVISRVLRAARKAMADELGREPSQAEVAEAVGARQHVYSRWERGVAAPTEESRRALETYLGLAPLTFDRAILEARSRLMAANVKPGQLPEVAAAIPLRPQVIRLIGPLLSMEDDDLARISDDVWRRYLRQAQSLGEAKQPMGDVPVENLDAESSSKAG